MRQTTFRPAFAFAAALACGILATASRTQTANLATYPTVAFTFDDAVSNGSPVWSLWSDGRGAYAHGKDSLGGTIDAEFTLDSGGFPSNVNLNLVKSKRKFNGTFTFVQCAVNEACTPLAQPGAFSDGWWLTVWDLTSMADGTTRLTQGEVMYGGASTNKASGPSYPRYRFTWCGDAAQSYSPNWVCTGRQADGSGQLLVRRSDVSGVPRWEITAADTPGTPGGDTAEALEVQSGTAPLVSRGLYRMPFHVWVACVKGCNNIP